MKMFEADTKYKNMSLQRAKDIVGNMAHWELLNMKKALTMMRALNSEEEEERLAAARVYLKNKGKRTPKTLAEYNQQKKKGWRSESARHALASKGIETGQKKKMPTKLPTFKYKNRTYVIDQRLNEVRSFEFGKKPITLSGAKGNELIRKAVKVYGKKWVEIENY